MVAMKYGFYFVRHLTVRPEPGNYRICSSSVRPALVGHKTLSKLRAFSSPDWLAFLAQILRGLIFFPDFVHRW